MTVTWNIGQLVQSTGDVPEGTVGRVYYELSAKTKDGERRSIRGSVALGQPGDKFTPLEDLTTKQIRAWLRNDPRAQHDAARLEEWVTTDRMALPALPS